MTRPRTASVLTALAVGVLLLCGATVGLPMTMFGIWQAEASCGDLGVVPAPSGVPAIGRWSTAQVSHAAVIVAVGRQAGIHPRGYVVALAVAMQESTLRNLANPAHPASLRMPNDGVGGDHDSLGVFQQRPTMGWGSVAELMTPTYATSAFYTRLVRVPGWERMRLTDAAQAVQRSAYPEAYQRWQDDAEQLAAHVLGLPSLDVIGGGDPAAPCGLDGLGPVPVGPNGWVQPVRAAVGSGFRTAERPGHDGVDLSAARNTPIRAAADGVVDTADCDSSTDTCDRDGSPSVSGCGWYVDIRSATNVVTRYCHMVARPRVARGNQVTAGQVIGFVGSSGHSSGPHLHYEVHLAVPPGPFHANASNAVDPAEFMRRQGAPLGP